MEVGKSIGAWIKKVIYALDTTRASTATRMNGAVF
jgi:hypothetical protein